MLLMKWKMMSAELRYILDDWYISGDIDVYW